MIPPRIELGTFCVLGRCDNRYTTESDTSSPPTEQLMTRRKAAIAIRDGARSKQNSATAENRTRINCLEGNYANHYTTVAARSLVPHKSSLEFAAVAQAPCTCRRGTFLHGDHTGAPATCFQERRCLNGPILRGETAMCAPSAQRVGSPSCADEKSH